MSRKPAGRALFLTVTDPFYFPGTVACVNSIFRFHSEAEVVVVAHDHASLTDSQLGLLREAGVRVIDSRAFLRRGRYLGPWELKAYAAHDLAGSYDLIIGVDSDLVLCAGVADVARRACRTGRFTGGKDRHDPWYGSEYRVYGIPPGSYNSIYMSTSIYFVATTAENRFVLRRWVACTNRAEYNGRGPYPGHSDQGLLNAILYHARGDSGIDLLSNALWSQHWTNWRHELSFEGGVLRNRSFRNARQRSLHCPGPGKFWENEYSDRIDSTHPEQALNYAWWLYLLWFGRCRAMQARRPAQLFPGIHGRLRRDCERFQPQIRPFAEHGPRDEPIRIPVTTG